MADDIKRKRKDDGQSIPAMLAAAPVKVSAAVGGSVKAATSAVTPSVAPDPVARATPGSAKASPRPAPVKAAPAPAAKSAPVAKAAPAVKPTTPAKTSAPVAKAPAPVAKAPAPVAKASASEKVSAPVAPAPAATVVEPAPVPAVAAAPAPIPTPPAAVPADSAKETTMATTIENVAQTGTDKAQAMFAETSERAKGAIAKSTKYVEELNAYGKGNVEALVESSKIAAKGLETLGQDAAEFTRKSFEDASAAFKTLASVKSPTEFMKLQSDYVRSAFDALVAESSRSTESLLKLAGEVAQPISNRVSVAADKMKVAA